jgi:UDP-glucose 4-epimerase
MRTVVLGKNGFIASHLQSHLKDSAVFLGSQELDLETQGPDEFTSTLKNVGVNSDDALTLIITSGLKRNHGETLEVFQRNITMAKNLYRILKSRAFHKVIYLSSCAVYGEDVDHPFIDETIAPTPTSFYGMAKLTTEHLLQSAHEHLIILRPPTIFGLGSGDNAYDPVGFYHQIHRAKELRLWGDGSELREFLFIDDLIKILLKILQSDQPQKLSGVYNLCSGRPHSFRDVIDTILVLQGLSREHIKLEERPRSKAKVDHRFRSQKISALMEEFQLSFTPLSMALNKIFHQSR